MCQVEKLLISGFHLQHIPYKKINICYFTLAFQSCFWLTVLQKRKIHSNIIEIKVSPFHSENYQLAHNIMHYISGVEPLKKGQQNVSAWIEDTAQTSLGACFSAPAR